MTPAARAAAAIEVLSDIESRRRPAADAMKDWGLAHRFAGSGDRAAISGLVYDALRKEKLVRLDHGRGRARAPKSWARSSRRTASTSRRSPRCSPARATLPATLTEAERARLAAADLSGAPAHVAGDFPEWLAPSSRRASALPPRRRAGRWLSARRSICASTSSRPRATRRSRALAHLKPEPTPFSPVGLRIAMRPDGRAPPLASDPAYVKGLVEVQDEGSQLAALLAEAKPGMQVLDLCAGAGGKTLALAAAMDNQGQIYAADPDAHRLAPIFARLARSGARNVQVRAPKGQSRRARRPRRAAATSCSSTRPAPAPAPGGAIPTPNGASAPARSSSGSRTRTKRLKAPLRFVKRGGRIVYVTCSVLRAENEDRIAAFSRRHDDFLPVDAAAQAAAAGLPALADHRSTLGPGFRLSPRTTGTDGFYIATLARI